MRMDEEIKRKLVCKALNKFAKKQWKQNWDAAKKDILSFNENALADAYEELAKIAVEEGIRKQTKK